MDEAELDLAAVMVEYMNEEERIIAETKETMARRGLSQERFSQVKKSLAEARGFKIGEEGIEFVLDQMLEALFSSKNIAEVFSDDKELRVFMRSVFEKYTGVDEELDKEARLEVRTDGDGLIIRPVRAAKPAPVEDPAPAEPAEPSDVEVPQPEPSASVGGDAALSAFVVVEKDGKPIARIPLAGRNEL